MALEEENDQYQELYRLLQQRRQQEAQDIFHRIRTSQNPLHVLQAIRDANVLLPQLASPILGEVDPRLRKLDREALDSAPFKVHARPWTVVEDDGIVSELISGFFEVDDLYYIPAIDRDTFLNEMQEANIERAKYCSPLLVNAICAYRCVSQYYILLSEAYIFVQLWSPRIKQMGFISGQDIAERFLQESKGILDNAIGHPTMTTIVALYLMFLTVTFQGKDRTALMYRYMAIPMFKQLHMTRRISQLKDDAGNGAQEKRLISITAWGLFHLEWQVRFSDTRVILTLS